MMASGGGQQLSGLVASYFKMEAKKKTCMKRVEELVVEGSGLKELGGVELKDYRAYHLALPLAALYMSAFLGILIGLTYVGTTSQLNSPYLSLTNDANALCEDVPQTVTGKFEGDYLGHWQTGTGFDQSKSIFAIEFLGSSLSNATFTVTMNEFAVRLADLGAKATKRNSLFANLVYSTFTFVKEQYNIRFFSTAEATDIFFNQLLTASLSGRRGTCNTLNTTNRVIEGHYDWGKKSLVAEIPFVLNRTYVGNALANGKMDLNWQAEPCRDIFKFFDPVVGVADPIINANKGGNADLVFNFDINSVIAVTAINLGLNFITLGGLKKINAKILIRPGTRPPIKYYDKLIAYIDPNSFSPDKTPIYCYDKPNMPGVFTDAQLAGPDICFLVSHDEGQNVIQVFYPVVAQMSNNLDQADPFGNIRMDSCSCPDQKYSGFCNEQDVLWGLIFDRGNSTNVGQLEKIAFMVQSTVVADPENGDIKAMERFEDMLGFTANVDYARNTAHKPIPNGYFNGSDPADSSKVKKYDGTWAKGKSYFQLLEDGWNKICPWGTCAAFVFESYSDSTTFPYLGLNQYHVQLADFSLEKPFNDPKYYVNQVDPIKVMMCTDTVSQAEALKGLSALPPITLTQTYYSCRPLLLTALISSIGNAAGSAGLALQLGALAFGFVIVRLINTYAYVAGPTAERLMGKTEKYDVLTRYEQLRSESVIETLKASVDTIHALNLAVSAQDKRAEALREENVALRKRMDRYERLDARIADNVPGLTYLASGGQQFGEGAMGVLNQVEGMVEEEIAELETALNLPAGTLLGAAATSKATAGAGAGAGAVAGADAGAGAGAGAVAVESSVVEDDNKLTSALRATDDERKKETLERLLRAEDDVDFYEKVLAKKFARVKLLFSFADMSEEEQRVAKIITERQAALRSGSEDGDGDVELSSVQLQTGPVVDSSVLGQVGYGLSYLNPFSYVAAATQPPQAQQQRNVRMTPEEAAARQMRGLPAVDTRYLAQRPGAPAAVGRGPRSGVARGAAPLPSWEGIDLEGAQPAGDESCLGTGPPPRRVQGGDEGLDMNGWDSDSDSEDGGVGGRDAWRSRPPRREREEQCAPPVDVDCLNRKPQQLRN